MRQEQEAGKYSVLVGEADFKRQYQISPNNECDQIGKRGYAKPVLGKFT